jgi:hypothetical protein
MGAAGPANPEGRSTAEDPSGPVFWSASDREEPARAGGEKTGPRRFRQEPAAPIGLTPRAGNGLETARSERGQRGDHQTSDRGGWLESP